MNICFLFPNIFQGNKGRHLRNIFSINNQNIDYLVVGTNKKESIKNIIKNDYFVKYNGIQFDNFKFLNNNTEETIKILNKYQIIIMCASPFISDFLIGKTSKRIEKKINPDIKKIYIHHGLYKVFSIDGLKNINRGYRINEIFAYRSYIANKYNYKIVTCCKNFENLFLHSKLKRKNLIKINSLPQFDLNEHLYKNIIKNKQDTIIVFVGEKMEQIKDEIIFKIIDLLRKLYTNKKIIIKIKFTTNVKNMKKFKKYIYNNYHNIELLSHESYLGRYLKCYLCIVTSGGTSFFENINFNKKTILFQYKIDEYDSTLFFKYPNIFKKLLICHDLENLEKNIKITENNHYFNRDYNNDIQKLNEFHINNPKILNFKHEFDNIIKNNI